jgi:hypothetical protein
MAGVDLSLFQFDYDLTFAALLMNGDGTVYHRYGTRDHTSATARLSLSSFVRLLRETLADHAEHQKRPQPPPAAPKRTIEDVPAMARKLKKEKIECIHCHMVNDAHREQAREEGRYSREAVLGMWPLPDKVGVLLDLEEPMRIARVAADSAAARAGLEAGDALVRLEGQRLRTQPDIQWVLENAAAAGASLALEYEHGGAPKRTQLILEDGWKAADAVSFSWRASMWQLRPRPGFGGQLLNEEAREGLRLAPGAFALKVGYLVDWGDEGYTGRNASKAGVRKGDVILSAAGKSDFSSELHFQSWFRFTQKPGTKVPIELLREGKRVTIELPVLE